MAGNRHLQNYNGSNFFGMCKVTFGWLLLTCTSVRAFLDGNMVRRNVDWRIHDGFAILYVVELGIITKWGQNRTKTILQGSFGTYVVWKDSIPSTTIKTYFEKGVSASDCCYF
jgi:hypothetical protein